jgi:hypothetical protein
MTRHAILLKILSLKTSTPLAQNKKTFPRAGFFALCRDWYLLFWEPFVGCRSR